MVITLHRQDPVCWICGSDQKLSREHFPKKADTRSYFAGTQGPMYRTDATTQNEIVQGPGSDRLRWGAPICAECNNARTSSHDRAWDQVRAFLLTHWASVVMQGEFDLQSIFPSELSTRSIALQLYFVKVLGCFIVDRNVNVDLNAFIKALMQGQAHPLLRLIFADASQIHTKSKSLLSASQPRILGDATGKIETIQLLYVLRPVCVQMTYATQETSLRAIPAAWHPRAGTSIIRLGPPIGAD